MKKWIYLVVPGTLLALFLVFYFSHQKEAHAREEARKVAVAQKQAEEAAKKKAAEDLAKEQALKTQREREEEIRKKEEDRRIKQEKVDKEIRDETNEFLAEVAKYEKEAKALQEELTRLEREKDRLGREAFDMAKQVELGEVARRTAEIESERMVAMIAERAQRSAMAAIPAPAPAR